jgi:hypothetical protein
VLMGFLYRGADCHHQVWEISAPMPVEGERVTALGRCVAEVSAAIRSSPAHWDFWDSTRELADLGLIPPQWDSSPAAEPSLVPAGGFLHDGPTDSAPARD